MDEKHDWMFSQPIGEASDELLREAIGWRNHLQQDLEVSIAANKEFLAKYQAELDQRAIQKHFVEHPNEVELRVGDIIYVYYRSTINLNAPPAPAREVIKSIDLGSKIVFTHNGQLPLSAAQSGRKAYLEREGEEQ